MSTNKVCILTAGVGSRMGIYADLTNKVLLPLCDKAIISHIIEKFPNKKFVVAVGFESQQVKDYIGMAHPEIDVTFVEVNPYQGPGSGPGYSLSCCEPYLHEPFVLVCGDTLWSEEIDIEEPGNWMGTYQFRDEDKSSYCLVETKKDGSILKLWDKQEVQSVNPIYAYTGLSKIEDTNTFFRGLRNGTLIAGEWQLSNGHQALIDEGKLVTYLMPTWVDVGTIDRYRRALALQSEYYDFSKNDEMFYEVNEHVIKFFKDKKTLRDRVHRAKEFYPLFPKIDKETEHFYSYKKIPGKILYECIDASLLQQFLHFLEVEVWHTRSMDLKSYTSLCHIFYYEKTQERIKKISQRHTDLFTPVMYQGALLDPKVVISNINWNLLEQGVPVRFHGDLQFENVLFDIETHQFTLIDIRQNFAGDTEVGDLYYDLGKMYMGMICNLSRVRKKQFHYEKIGDEVLVEFPDLSLELQDQFKNYVYSKGLDFNKVKLMAGLIMVNMAGLHTQPLDLALWYFGLNQIRKCQKV
ncbi:MAG: NTP transferase domain-containing protein [Bdellovibrionales bacterium]